MPATISTLDGQAFTVNVAYAELRDVLFAGKTTQIRGATFSRDSQGRLLYIEFASGDNQSGPMTVLPANIVNIQPGTGDAAFEG